MERDLLAQLTLWKDKENRKPLILKGARQVGKTHLLKTFGTRSFPSSHYFNFERQPELREIFELDFNPHRIVRELELIQNLAINPANDLVIFDEIQDCPKALTSLKYFSEELPALALCAAGSLLGLSLTPASFPVGKVEFLTLFPLSFFEMLAAAGEEMLAKHLRTSSLGELSSALHPKLWDYTKAYFITGGLPEVVQLWVTQRNDPLTAYPAVRELQENLLLSYQADIAKHSGKQNSMHIERLWRNVPEQLAREQNTSANKFVFKDVIPGIRGYERLAGVIDWLEKAGLILRVPIVNRAELPLAAYTKENTFKLYHFDIGLLGAMARIPYQSILKYNYGIYKGYFAENFVAQELTTAGVPLFSWREKELELEFLATIGAEIIPIEVKSAANQRSRSFSNYYKRYAPPHGVILSGMPPKPLSPSSNAYHLPLYMAYSVTKSRV